MDVWRTEYPHLGANFAIQLKKDYNYGAIWSDNKWRIVSNNSPIPNVYLFLKERRGWSRRKSPFHMENKKTGEQEKWPAGHMKNLETRNRDSNYQKLQKRENSNTYLKMPKLRPNSTRKMEVNFSN